MTITAEVREFLTTRRSRVLPHMIGLPPGGARRVPGLRREEVAAVAGISVDYYVRLERGHLAGVSDRVLERLSAALLLDEAECRYLTDLARIANTAPFGPPMPESLRGVTPNVQKILDSLTGPTWVRNDRMDLIGANRLGKALYAPIFESTHQPANSARFTFLDPAAERFYADWDETASAIVAALRSEAARSPSDSEMIGLVGQLSMRSARFRALWARHDVQQHRSGRKRLRHPIVGDLELTFDALQIASAPGLTVLTYSATPGSPSAASLALLASWDASDEDSRPQERSEPPWHSASPSPL